MGCMHGGASVADTAAAHMSRPALSSFSTLACQHLIPAHSCMMSATTSFEFPLVHPSLGHSHASSSSLEATLPSTLHLNPTPQP